VTFRTQVDNLQRDLKPQMLANMRIQGESRHQLVVPQEAVVRETDQDYVYVRIAPGQYRFTRVELGNAHQDVRPVKSGLRQGDWVVRQGAFHLHNERKRAEFQ
jgi:cobalt-zinc-cadmium efflux system membrane fusion protein